MTDADTQESHSNLTANTPTPAPRKKVCDGLYSSTPASVRLCLCVNSPQCACYGSLRLRLSAVKCSVLCVTFPDQNLHEPFEIPLHSPF